MHIIIKEVKRLPHSKWLETEYSASVLKSQPQAALAIYG